ncbi:MAG: S9 family peptidase [Candidatus Zixiibacteriota bacterium]|nr:MAG: S9 family peptidase [candidate division Zixibacteria bacterium]
MIYKLRNIRGCVWASAVILFIIAASSVTAIDYPESAVETVADTLHGTVIEDPYRWLEDQWSERTRDWIDRQNAFTRSYLDTLSVRPAVRERLAELMRVDEVSIPDVGGGRLFYKKRDKGEALFSIVMQEGPEASPEVLIDPRSFSDDESKSVGIVDVTCDGKLLAYSIREGGQDETVVRFFDVDSRRNLADSIPKSLNWGVGVFSHDGRGYYYATYVADVGPRAFYHEVGKADAEDQMIFGEAYGPGKYIDLEISDDGRYLIIFVSKGSSDTWVEVHYDNLEDTSGIITLVDEIEASFAGEVISDQFYLLTNWNAPNRRVLAANLDDPDPSKWREIIPEGETAIEDVSLAGGKLAARYVENASYHLRLFDLEGEPKGELALPSLGRCSNLYGQPSDNVAYYSFSSFVFPYTIYRHDVSTGTSDLWFQESVSIDPADYVVKQVWYSSKDGTRIPMFVVHGKDLTLDGNNPARLTGYGGFNSSQTPKFDARTLTWVEHGGVYAVANLRGGGEFGEEWHRAGMRENKQNVYDDFIAAGEWLIDNGYTRASKLGIAGGSNGGLLVGAAVTQRPDLFGAVVCSYPLLDMVRYHLFLVARFWIPEYGSSEDPDQFKYLLDYSPYHNIRSGADYPAVLFVTGDNDTRVDPSHGRKMTARMQALTGSDNPILLKYDTQAGHSHGQAIDQVIDDRADRLSFLLWQLNK